MSLTRTKVTRVVSAQADPASSTARSRTARRQMADIVGSTPTLAVARNTASLACWQLERTKTPLNCVHYLIQLELRGEPSYERRAGLASLTRLPLRIKGAARRTPLDRVLQDEGEQEPRCCCLPRCCTRSRARSIAMAAHAMTALQAGCSRNSLVRKFNGKNAG